jgi:hypothetical protein
LKFGVAAQFSKEEEAITEVITKLDGPYIVVKRIVVNPIQPNLKTKMKVLPLDHFRHISEQTTNLNMRQNFLKSVPVLRAEVSYL